MSEQIDRLILERVMSFRFTNPREYFWFRPSTNLHYTWQVVEKLVEDGAEINFGCFYCHKRQKLIWNCDLDYPVGCNWLEEADTAAMAVCLAVLKAKGIDINTI